MQMQNGNRTLQSLIHRSRINNIDWQHIISHSKSLVLSRASENINCHSVNWNQVVQLLLQYVPSKNNIYIKFPFSAAHVKNPIISIVCSSVYIWTYKPKWTLRTSMPVYNWYTPLEMKSMLQAKFAQKEKLQDYLKISVKLVGQNHSFVVLIQPHFNTGNLVPLN